MDRTAPERRDCGVPRSKPKATRCRLVDAANDLAAQTGVADHGSMERQLTEWERDVLLALANVEQDGAAMVVESLPHLAVTGGCDCGCASFNVRDTRFPVQPHRLTHFSNGSVPGVAPVGFVLWTGEDDRPLSVDVDNEPGELPDPRSITASVPGPA